MSGLLTILSLPNLLFIGRNGSISDCLYPDLFRNGREEETTTTVLMRKAITFPNGFFPEIDASCLLSFVDIFQRHKDSIRFDD